MQSDEEKLFNLSTNSKLLLTLQMILALNGEKVQTNNEIEDKMSFQYLGCNVIQRFSYLWL